MIIDDRPKSNLTKEEAQKKIKSEGIPVSKVVKLSKLKSDYRPFEAKRKLCDSYNMFFTDKRVVPLLPRLLGKHFFKKKKIPVPLDLKHKNWKEQIEKACSSALLFLKTGTCSVVKVAKVSMEEDEIVENVAAAVNGIVEIVPKKWANVRSLHLKLADSLALPLYQAIPDMKLKIEGAKLEEVSEKEDKDDVENEAKKKDLKVGKKKKGRIHEVRYMDYIVGDEVGEDESGDEDNGLIEEEEDNEKDEIVEELEDKKETKGTKRDKGALKELNSSVKGLKKKASKDKDKSVKRTKDGLSAKGKKENEMPSENEDSGKKKKKRSGVEKPEGGVMKVKTKKIKKNA